MNPRKKPEFPPDDPWLGIGYTKPDQLVEQQAEQSSETPAIDKSERRITPPHRIRSGPQRGEEEDPVLPAVELDEEQLKTLARGVEIARAALKESQVKTSSDETRDAAIKRAREERRFRQ